MIISDSIQQIQLSEIKALLLKTNITNSEIRLFEQLDNGLWQTT